MTVLAVHADAVLPGDAPAIPDGALVLDGNQVVEVGAAVDVLPRHRGGDVQVRRVRGAVMPGLINAHTHLELSSLRGKVSGGAGFVPWLDRMMGMRAGERPEEDGNAIDDAAAEVVRSGTVAVGEVTNTLGAVGALARHGLAGSVFHEIFGLDRERALARVDELEEVRTAEFPTWPSADLAYAPAPHTLYTTHHDAVRLAVEGARKRGVRTTIHLAEHAAERTFLLDGTGPFADFARARRLPVDAFSFSGKGPIETARELGLLAPDVLLVHLTDARRDELEVVARSGAHVVLCPRSNLFIEVKLPPLTELLRAGVTPALGTDSLASNQSLDLLAEAKALAERFPGVPSVKLLEMATHAGARALGRNDLGRLARGTRPGVIAVEGEGMPASDPIAWVLKQGPKARTIVAPHGGLS